MIGKYRPGLSDEELALQLNAEAETHPEEFSGELDTCTECIPTSKYFVKATAGTTIPTILKWL